MPTWVGVPGSGPLTIDGYLKVAHGTVDVNTNPTIEGSVEWNEAATAFTGIKFNATGTGASTSYLMVLQQGSADKYKVRQDGQTEQGGSIFFLDDIVVDIGEVGTVAGGNKHRPRDVHIGRNLGVKGPRPWIDVMEHGAIADGTTDDTTAIQAAIDAAGQHGVVFFPEGTYKTTAVLNVSNSDVWLRGVGTGSIIKPTNASALRSLRVDGTQSGAQNLNANASEGALAVELVAGGVAALGLVAGDQIVILDSASIANYQIAQVRTIASETVTIYGPLHHAFTTANTARVAKITPRSNVKISDLIFDCSGLAAADNNSAIYATNTYALTLQNVTVTGCKGAAIYSDYSYHAKCDNITLINSGTTAENDFYFRAGTAFTTTNITSSRANGFGPLWQFCNGGTASDIVCIGANGRGIKLYHVASSTYANLVANGAYAATLTGFSVDGLCHRLTVNNVVAIANQHEGVLLTGTGNNYCVITGIVAFNNNIGGGGGGDIGISATDTDNLLQGVWTSITDNGTRTIKVRTTSSGEWYLTGELRLDLSTSTTASAGARTLPANPQDFLVVNIGGTSRRIPFYPA